MLKKYNTALIIGLLISIAICFGTFLFLIFKFNTLSSFEESLSSLVGGAVGGFATFFTVLILLMKNNKDNSKKELIDYCNNLTILSGKCGQCIRSLEEYNTLIEQKNKMLKKQSFKKQKYTDLLQIYYNKNKANEEISIDKELRKSKESIEQIKKDIKKLDKKIEMQYSKYLRADDRKIYYLMQIRIQLSLFINIYFYEYDEEITDKSQDLYREINSYLDVSNRRNLDFEKFDKIQNDFNDFIGLLVDSLQD